MGLQLVHSCVSGGANLAYGYLVSSREDGVCTAGFFTFQRLYLLNTIVRGSETRTPKAYGEDAAAWTQEDGLPYWGWLPSNKRSHPSTSDTHAGSAAGSEKRVRRTRLDADVLVALLIISTMPLSAAS